MKNQRLLKHRASASASKMLMRSSSARQAVRFRGSLAASSGNSAPIAQAMSYFVLPVAENVALTKVREMVTARMWRA